MARTKKDTCDQCGTEKKDTNHWFIIAPVAKMLSIVPLETISPNLISASTTLVCGQNCASILMAKWMATGGLGE